MRFAIEVARLILPLVILVVGFLGFRALGARTRPPLKQVEENQPTYVRTVAAEPHSGPLHIEVEGVATPFREVSVAAEVAGRVKFKDVKCRAGTYVDKEMVLVRVDDRDYQFELRRLQQELQQAKDSLTELEVEGESTTALIELSNEDLELQGNEVDRIRQLVERKAAAVSDIEKARRTEIAARNSLMTLQNQLRMQRSRRNRLESARQLIQVRLEQAQLDLTRTEVKAPLSGVIVSDPVEENSYVQRGAALFVIEDTSRIEVRCSLRVKQLHWLWSQESSTAEATPHSDFQIPPAAATIVYQLGDRKFVWEGVLSRFEGAGIDERTRTAPCRVSVANPRDVRQLAEGRKTFAEGAPVSGIGPPSLMRGMYVTVRIHAEPKLKLLKIPEAALRPGNRVWLMRDGRFAEAAVSVARIEEISEKVAGTSETRTRRFALIRADKSTVKANDRLITSPLSAPQPGMPVEELKKS